MLRTHLRNNMTIGRLFTTQANSIKNITGPQLQELLNKPEITVKSTAKVPNLIIVDVRERSEVETHGKIKGALNVPLKVAPSLFSAALSDLDKHAKASILQYLIKLK